MRMGKGVETTPKVAYVRSSAYRIRRKFGQVPNELLFCSQVYRWLEVCGQEDWALITTQRQAQQLEHGGGG